ncbi:millepora cytotoxin-1-like [Branchiostoma floridae]|uniref:Millepora cytotoxin-1-like n=1 Tax=Branchiostoma floridae TaxID=7739 RepID=A0A9J7L1T8_BRAFL|nr:millepora cytotoxin-1-like [Branchiostoma floridae]
MTSTLFRALLAVLVVGLLVGQSDAWRRRRRRRRCPNPTDALSGAQTAWDATFMFECPGAQVIRRIRSAHCNTVEDRVWRFECGTVPGVSRFDEAFWSAWLNEYNGVMNFQCPFNAIVTGFRSEHRGNDRKWKLKCSKVNGMTTFNHAQSNYANEFDLPGDYTVPSGYYLRGMHSFHDGRRGDRRYQYQICLIDLP